MDDEILLRTCHEVVDAVPPALATLADWSPAGDRPGQYALDLVADRAVLEVLAPTGIGVLSEESGRHGSGTELVAVVDPVDGSTNASRGIGWYATSVCVVDAAGPRVAVVGNLATGARYHAVRGGGAWCDGVPIRPSGCSSLDRALVALSGYPAEDLGWAQYRAFGASALDLCAVADGQVDAFTVAGRSRPAPWDYLGAMLVCTEAGAAIGDLLGQPLVELDHGTRRAVVAAATATLLDALTRAASVSQPPPEPEPAD